MERDGAGHGLEQRGYGRGADELGASRKLFTDLVRTWGWVLSSYFTYAQKEMITYLT